MVGLVSVKTCVKWINDSKWQVKESCGFEWEKPIRLHNFAYIFFKLGSIDDCATGSTTATCMRDSALVPPEFPSSENFTNFNFTVREVYSAPRVLHAAPPQTIL